MHTRGLVALVLVAACASPSDGRSPADPLGGKGFWSLVEQAKTNGGTAIEDRAAALAQLLSKDGQADLEGFQQHLVAASLGLYTNAFGAAAGIVCGPLEADALTNARSWVIAQGKQVYDAVRADPDALADLPDVKDACDGSAEAYGDAALPRYSDLGFEPGSDAFPSLEPDSAATGPTRTSFPKLTRRFGSPGTQTPHSHP